VIDILVNNAGIAHVGTIENTTEDDLVRLFNVNVKGFYNCMHEIIPVMKKKNAGCILNMASVAAAVGLPDRFAYSMTKGAVIGMTISVAKDYLGIIFAATLFHRQEYIRRLLMDISKKISRGRKRRCLRNYQGRNPSGEWESRKRSPIWLCISAVMRQPLLRAAII
jgi:hypothetical protein